MAITKCKHCDLPYWRYRRDWPPPRFCSQPFSDTWKLDHPKAEAQPPEPHVILRSIKDHNRLFHNANSEMIDWDCKFCERLQEEYAASIAFHVKFAPESA